MSTPIQLTIDGKRVEVAPGQTVLHAARKLGIDRPTLCYLEKCGPLNTCLACVVKVRTNGGGKLVPSCGTVAQPGMVVESETDEVHEARRTALELLLSDHVGDCLSPCHRLCPLNVNIPRIMRLSQENRRDEAMTFLTETLPLAAILGRLCHAPCEGGCRRSAWDQPVAIRELERSIGDELLACNPPRLPSRKPATGKRIAIIGAGPCGLAAAFALVREGHSCTVLDRADAPGGSLRRQVAEGLLPQAVLDAETRRLELGGVQFTLGTELGKTIHLADLQQSFDAILLACGEMDGASAAGLGLATAGSGLQADPATFQTGAPKTFAAGSVVRPVKHLVRAMADGMAAADCIRQFLAGSLIGQPRKTFSSTMGRIDKDELALFLLHASPKPRLDVFSCDLRGGEAQAESFRCVHCDCRAAGNCSLQTYAAAYGANAGRFRAERQRFEQQLQHGSVIFEPGKCIKCGICVRITELAREPLGLTFIGRGFDVRIAAPFNQTMAEALQKTAAECIEACPTGALVRRDSREVPRSHE